MPSISWLHFSDFHKGMSDHNVLWPDIEQQFFDDLEKIQPVSYIIQSRRESDGKTGD